MRETLDLVTAQEVLVGPHKMIGLPYPQSQELRVIEMRPGNGKHAAVMDSTCDEAGNVGHLGIYSTLLPDDMSLSMIPCSQPVVETSGFVRDSIATSQVVILAGGEHLGWSFTGKEFTPEDNADHYGGENPIRDLLDKQMLEEVLYNHDKFSVGICRGFQVMMWGLTGLAPQNLLSYHYTAQGENILSNHAVANVLKNYYPAESYPGMEHVNEVNSMHRQGYTLGQIAGHLNNMIAVGWYPLLLDANPGVPLEERAIEGIIRIATSGEVTGIGFQGHPERDNSFNGLNIRMMVKKYIGRFVGR